ncbi:tyrosine-type recombinase/integrase [uncultured Clostridium sp.]|uniref:tyrosine-type recombinase/integrase n=1 Tax=uncultured Clostridium sp. TaxID=59620 RepID=UPI003217AF07
MEKIINQYKEYLIIQGRSENTIKNYMCDLNKFYNYFTGKNIEQIQIIDLMEYVKYIKYNGGRKNTEAKPRTINRNIVALKNFYKWMKKYGIIVTDYMQEIEFVSVPTNEEVIYMDVNEAKDFLNVIHTEGAKKKRILKDFTSLRDELMFKIYLETGLRSAELSNVKINDIDLNEKKIKILGKKNKIRYVAINDKTIELYKNYLPRRVKVNRKNKEYLLLSVKGNIMDNTDINDLIKQYLSMSNMDTSKAEKMSVHKLRHSYASIQYEQNTPTLAISKNMGHANPSITERIYIHFSNNKALDLSRKNSEILDDY